MAWRPSEALIAGELDNTTPGKVTGWLSFVGLADKVRLDLAGDFHRDVRGTVLRLANPSPSEKRAGYMEGFCLVQTGKAGDITAGRPPRDYVGYPYIEWYAENGRVVLELEASQVKVVGVPRPWQVGPPVSRAEQLRHMREWMASLAGGVVTSPDDGKAEG